MKVEQAVNLFKEYQRMNLKKTPSTLTRSLFPDSAMTSEVRS